MTGPTLTPIERAAALALARLLIWGASHPELVKTPAIHPTMRPDPQVAAVTHGTLMSHAQA